MSRSERYIRPSNEELQRQLRAMEIAKELDEKRETLLRATLKKMKKADVVELTLRIAQEASASQWTLEQQIEVDKPIDLLVHDIQFAIDAATQVDERQLNYNFEYDGRAYNAVQYGLSQLIRKGKIAEAKALALQLMRKGSHQMDCSDEGLMQKEIENCLRPVISQVAESSGGSNWALEMIGTDSTGGICREELTVLAEAIDRD